MKFFLGIVLVLSIKQLEAQIVTDRPDQTEAASTVGAGNLQIETGFLIEFEGDNQPSTWQILAPTTLIKYGITEWFELRLVSQFEIRQQQNQTTQGIGDLEVGARAQIFKHENEKSEIAFLAHLVTPLGTKELTNDRFGVIAKLAVAHELTKAIQLSYNIGYTYLGVENGNLTYSIALGINVNEKFGVYLEPYGEIENLEKFILNFDAGLTYLLNDNFQLDFSFGTGINQRMNYLSFGFSMKIDQG